MKQDQNYIPYNLNIFKSGYLTWWRPLHSLKSICRRFKYIYQRAKYGFCDYDLYDVGDFAYEVLIQSLKHYLKENDCFPDGTTFNEWNQKVEDLIKTLEAGRNQSHINPLRAQLDSFSKSNEWFKKFSTYEDHIAKIERGARIRGLIELASMLPDLWM